MLGKEGDEESQWILLFVASSHFRRLSKRRSRHTAHAVHYFCGKGYELGHFWARANTSCPLRIEIPIPDTK
jgi:hypothetical protein